MPKRESSKGAIAGAHPTSPGGMSQKALIAELVERHGFNKASAEQMSWPEMINEVSLGRLAREREAKNVEGLADDMTEAEAEFTEPADTEDDVLGDLDALLAEADAAPSTGPVAADPEPLVIDPAEPLFIGLPGTADYIFDGHMGIGPSNAERWMSCTASPAAVKKFLETLTPNQQRGIATSTMAARQGTTAHAAAEVEALVLLGRMETEEAEQTLLELTLMPDEAGEAYDDEMGEYITEYVDMVNGYAASYGYDRVLIEERVTAAVFIGEGDDDVHEITGSLDFAALPTKAEPVLVVGDLKYGNGIDVDVNENPQVRIYALGAMALLTDEDGRLPKWLKDVTYHIIQPRLGGIKTYTESIDALLDWRDNTLSPALAQASGGPAAGATLTPSEVACQWCPVRGSCPALALQRTEAAKDLFTTIVDAEYENGPGSFPETGLMDNATLGQLYEQVRGLTDIAKSLREEAERRLYRGEHVPGFGLVNYTPPRKWKPEAQDAIASGEVEFPAGVNPDVLFTEPGLITPTAAEKILKGNYTAIVDLVDKPDKRPVIAPEGDRRKKWEGKAPEDMFDDETGEQ